MNTTPKSPAAAKSILMRIAELAGAENLDDPDGEGAPSRLFLSRYAQTRRPGPALPVAAWTRGRLGCGLGGVTPASARPGCRLRCG